MKIEITRTHKDDVFATIDGKQYKFDVSDNDLADIIEVVAANDLAELSGLNDNDYNTHEQAMVIAEERDYKLIEHYIQEIINDGELSEWEVLND